MTTLSRSTFLAGTAALAATPRALSAADLPVINAGTIPADVAAVLTYASDRGYFKDAGLDVQIQMMQSGPVIANAVIGGALQVGASNIASLAAARENGLLVKVFAPAGMATPRTLTDVLMVKPDSPIKTIANLNGKTVAINATRTMQDAAFRLWIDKHGGDSTTIKLIEIPFPAMLAALDSGRVDAAIPSEPFTSEGSPVNRILGGVYGSMPGPILVFGFFATDAWLDANPQLAVKFAGAIHKAALWANAHPGDSQKMLVALTKLDPEVADRMHRATYATSLDSAIIQPVLDNAVRYGMLAKPMAASELIWQPPAK
jgi:NitT/TauT family transport system substrate-binding protein